MSKIRRKARDLLWIHTYYNKDNAPKGQDSVLVVNKERTKKHAEVYTPREGVEFIHKSALVLLSSTTKNMSIYTQS